jgi:hypothetical protein
MRQKPTITLERREKKPTKHCEIFTPQQGDALHTGLVSLKESVQFNRLVAGIMVGWIAASQ